MAKASRNADLVGQVHSFRLARQVDDDQRSYAILKSTDAPKKSKNFIAVLPSCLMPKGLNLKEVLEVQGIVLQMVGGSEGQQLPLVSVQQELILLKEQIYDADRDGEMTAGKTFVGVVNGAAGKAGQVTVRFMNGVQKAIKAKDLNSTQNISGTYYPGKPIRVAVNKLGRLCTKESVIEPCLAGQQGAGGKSDKEVQLDTFVHQFSTSVSSCPLKIGDVVEATVQLVKDYGIIGQIATEGEQGEGEQAMTGFVVNEQRKFTDKKHYKVGQKMKCCVLDIDPVKRIVDLSEKLAPSTDA